MRVSLTYQHHLRLGLAHTVLLSRLFDLVHLGLRDFIVCQHAFYECCVKVDPLLGTRERGGQERKERKEKRETKRTREDQRERERERRAGAGEKESGTSRNREN
jgi:hypothetical protein